MRIKLIFWALFFLLAAGCSSKIKERSDKVYSRHLQKHFELEIISTPSSGEKNDFNLVIINEGDHLGPIRARETLDSLYKKKSIKPIVLVGVKTMEGRNLFGVAGSTDYRDYGKAAGKYTDFIINELLPFIKKNSGVRKFNTVTLAGFAAGGLSAFDIGWNNWQKFDKIGVFSGDFKMGRRQISNDSPGLILKMLNSSRKRPKLKFWFYSGLGEERKAANKDYMPQDTYDLINAIKKKNVIPPGDIFLFESPDRLNDIPSWSSAFPEFLIWVAGK